MGDSNPKVISGEIAKYTGIMDCFTRVSAEQGAAAFWRGNTVNCIRYAPQQGSALAFNDQIKRMVPKYNPKTDYYKDFGMKLLSGGMAGGWPMWFATPLTSRARVLLRTWGRAKDSSM